MVIHTIGLSCLYENPYENGSPQRETAWPLSGISFNFTRLP